ncbi:MAG: metal ABC transporter permease [Spirochaetales bacterium]|nr:metal ABC transporter permease [Spirochaetales bacterium]
MLLDEPLNRIDVSTQEPIYHTLERLTAAGKATIYRQSTSPARSFWIVVLSPTLLARTTVVAMQTVGVVLVLGLLATPAATASMVSRRSMSRIMALSIALSVASTIIGFYASYY